MNPSLNLQCTNLLTGIDYCVALVNGTTLVTPTFTATGPTATGTPTPHQPNMVSNCTAFDVCIPDDTCDSLTTRNGINIDQLELWNPDVGSSCTLLLVGDYYCVAAPSPVTTTTSSVISTTTSALVTTPTPHQPDMVTGCNKFDICISGDSCGAMATRNSISIAQLETWNPDVGTTCEFLDVGDWYCVGLLGSSSSSTTTPPTTTATSASIATPTPHQPNMVANCDKFDICVSGDNCGLLAARNGITAEEVETWNPDVGMTCEFLDVGDWYCVGLVG